MSPALSQALEQIEAPRLIIMPNYISDRIDALLDAAIAKVPDAAADRDLFRQQIVNYFAQTGNVPDFSLVPRSEGATP